MENIFDKLIESLDKSFEIAGSSQKLQLVLTIAEMCLKYNKKPSEVIELFKDVVKELKRIKSFSI